MSTQAAVRAVKFNKNYNMGLTVKKLIVAVLLLLFICPQSIYSQNQECSITAPFSPDKIYAERHPDNVQEINHFLATSSWDSLENARVSDDQYLSVDLERYDRSHVIRFSNFNFNVPNLATIDGLRISFEGQSIGEGLISQMQLQFYTNGPVGSDVALIPSLLGDEFVNDTLAFDRWWKYGHHNDKWGKEWTPSEVNSSEFGFVLQIQNQTDEFIQAIIDQVSVSVYYTPPHNLCAHECVVFSTDLIDGVTNFQWEFPSNFDQIVSPVNQHILNLNVLDNIEGSYQVCVTPEGHDRCCMDFVIMDCNLASVGNLVWKDANSNGAQDPGEAGIPGVRVQIFNESGFFLEDQFTDSNGNYLFTDLYAGNYKIKTSAPTDDCELSTADNQDENTDSDYDIAYGPTCSDFFSLDAGQNRDDIDFGWSFKFGSVSGCIFRDRNGDSSIIDEPGMPDVTVTLHNCDGTVVTSTTTNADGRYTFESLQVGQYYVSTTATAGFIAAVGGDSAFELGTYNSPCVEVAPNETEEIKLGYIPLGRIGDYVFYDENEDGLHSDEDWPIENLQVFLFNSANELLSSTVTTEQGFYLFDNLPPGDYVVVADYPSVTYLPTALSPNDDSTMDSNGMDIGNLQVSSGVVNLFDGGEDLTIDFGFIKRTASITGTYFRDGEGDGVFAGNPGIAGATVTFHNCNGALIATRTTDENGQYTFTGFVGGNYHIVFSSVNGMMSSSIGESQIDNIIAQGATACFTIPNEDTITINGAAIPLSRVGDMVFDDENRNGVFDNNESGMENVEITLFDSNNAVIGTTLTNSEGIYIFENLLPGNCYMEIKPVADYEITEANVGGDDTLDSDAIFVNGVIASESFNLIDGDENMDMDFGFRRTGGTISGRLWNDGDGDSIYGNETGAGNRAIRLMTCEGDIVTSTTTNDEGLFIFTPIAAGNYYVVVEDIDGEVFATMGDSQISNTIENGATDCLTVSNAATTEVLLGVIPTSNIGDYIWIDQNQNGIQDVDEIGILDVAVNLLDEQGQSVMSTTSDASGRYNFENIPAGNYSITVQIPFGYNLTQSNVGEFDTDSEGTVVGNMVESSLLALRNGVDQNDHDFGFFISTGNLIGSVWRDSNGDLIQENELGIEGINVSLYSCDVVLLNTTQTDVSGSFNFDNLSIGDYFVVVNPQTGFEIATGGDSDVTNIIMPGATDCLTIGGNANGQFNIGYIPLAGLGDYVWFDENKNGLQDVSELGFHDIEVGLMGSGGALLEIINTNENGFYQFTDLRPGDYSIAVALPSDDFTNTLSLAGDTSLDSEGTLVNNSLTSGTILIFDGIDQMDHDFGFIEKEVDPEFGFVDAIFYRDSNGDGTLVDESGIADATVILKSCDGTQVATALTNLDGGVNFPNVPPGDYYLVFPELDNFINNDFGASEIDNQIEAGATSCFPVQVNNGYIVIAGTTPLNSIGDYIWDDINKDGIQDSDEVGIENIDISLYDENDILVETITSDANGFYQFTRLLPGSYYATVDIGDYKVSPSMAIADTGLDSDLTMVDGVASSFPILLNDGMTVNSNDFGLYKETTTSGGGSEENIVAGIIYEDLNGNGVYDGGEPRQNGVAVSLILLSTGVEIDNTISSNTALGDGYYEFSGFPNGDYSLEFDLESTSTATEIYQGSNTGLDSDIVLTDGVFKSETLTFMDGTVIEGVNAGYYYPVSIGDYVWFDFNGDGIQDFDEPGANDYIVRLYDGDGTQLLMTTSKDNPLTGNNGYYLFNNLKPGDYYIGLNLGFGTSVTLENAGADENLDSDIDNSNGPGTTEIVTLISGEQRGNLDIGLQSTPGSIGNYLWVDNNGNGIQNGSEPGLNDVDVSLFTEDGDFVRVTTTADNNGEAGYYLFDNVPIGDYYIVFDLPEGYLPTAPFRGGNTSMDSDITNLIEQGSSNIFSIGSGVFSDDIDCGVYKPATLGNYIWDDKDKDGTQEFGEFGISGVEVAVFRMDEGEVGRTMTNSNGMYMFDELRPGQHYLVVEAPDGFQFTQAFAGTDDSIDSDVDLTGTTAIITLDQEDVFTNYDVGLVPARATIGGRTWDDDGNGLQDFQELSITDVIVNLLDENMDLIETQSTNVLGRYAFTSLATGDHFIQFEAPDGYIFTVKDQSFNDNEDSDAADNGLTDVIAVTSTTSLLTVDAGFVFTGFSPQPIEDINLTGYHSNGTSHLSWIDGNFESGNKYALLRSSDGINFEKITQGKFENNFELRYQENTNLLHESRYSYKIEKYLGVNIIAVSNIWTDQRISKFQVALFPNPASEYIEVEFDQYQDGVVKIEVLDIYGNKLKVQTFKNMTAGNAKLRFDLEDFANGMYLLRVDMGSKIESQFISILK